jgi:hypothetical protein
MVTLGNRLTTPIPEGDTPDEFALNNDFNNTNQLWLLITMIVEQTSKQKSIHVFTCDILDSQQLFSLFETFFKEKQILAHFQNRPDLMNK